MAKHAIQYFLERRRRCELQKRYPLLVILLISIEKLNTIESNQIRGKELYNFTFWTRAYLLELSGNVSIF